MKKMRRVFALLLTMVMVLGMSTSVFAAGNKTDDKKVTVSGVQSGDTVELYQVLKWVENDGWTFVAPFNGITQTEKNDVLYGQIHSDLAEKIAELATSPKYTNSDETDSREITADPGLYLVLVKPKNSGIIYNPAFVANDYYGDDNSNVINMSEAGYADETIMKKDTITVEKTVDGKKETSKYSLGDDIDFSIVTKIPTYPTNSINATLKITDAPTNLTIDPDTVVVKVGDTTVYNKDTAMASATGSVRASGTKLEVDFTKDYILANGGKGVTVTYRAKLTNVSNLTVGDNVISGAAENPVTVKYNPNPYVDTTNDVEDIDIVKTYGIVFEKIDSETKEALADAVFDLYDAAGTTKLTSDNGYFKTVKTAVVNGHAYVYWEGLKAGTYTIKETKAPVGYVKVDDFQLTVGDDAHKADNPATAIEENNYNADKTGTDNAVRNTPGKQLPSTGGIGTTIIYAIGAILVIGAGVVLVTRRRMNVQ